MTTAADMLNRAREEAEALLRALRDGLDLDALRETAGALWRAAAEQGGRLWDEASGQAALLWEAARALDAEALRRLIDAAEPATLWGGAAALGLALWLVRAVRRRRRPAALPAPAAAVAGSGRAADLAALQGRIGRPVRLGLAAILLFVVGFGAWGAVVPLAGGAVAPGVISPDGSRKTVQHLEGGIIGKLLVRDGDVVAAGQPLLVLENVQPRATYEILLSQHRTLMATRARLEAEQLGRETLDFPAELQAAEAEPEVRGIIEGQRRMFETRQAIHAARKRVLRQRVEQLAEQIRGLEAQVESTSRQLALIADELKGKEELWRKELITKPEVLRLQRARAEVYGDRGEYIASIAKARQQISETELQLLALDAERADQIATQLAEVRAEFASVHERLFASRDILNRTVVSAPVSGSVVDLRFKTEGGVVRPGEAILDIVPAEDNLLIDARVSPIDIDVVHVGLSAQIHLSAYSTRNVPRVPGVVKSVSADRLLDEQTAQPYYLARVEVDRSEVRRIDPQIELVPGMPAEVLIVTGERTMLDYLFQPFRDAFRRSFREA